MLCTACRAHVWIGELAHLLSQHGVLLSSDCAGKVFPPCGVVPFRGLVLYVTPICYLYAYPHQVYGPPCLARTDAVFLKPGPSSPWRSLESLVSAQRPPRPDALLEDASSAARPREHRAAELTVRLRWTTSLHAGTMCSSACTCATSASFRRSRRREFAFASVCLRPVLYAPRGACARAQISSRTGAQWAYRCAPDLRCRPTGQRSAQRRTRKHAVSTRKITPKSLQ
jgi:hypothetical protein